MKVIEDGHIYDLDVLDGDQEVRVTFVNREGSAAHAGTQSQEVLRMLIHRQKYLDKKIPCPEGKEILNHLRQAFGLYETRALRRKVEKGKVHPEMVKMGKDGHFKLERQDND